MQEILSKKNIGSRLKRLRLKYQLSQEEIAGILGLSRSNYSQIELGNQYPTYDVLTKIARYYNKTYEWLIHGKESLEADIRKPEAGFSAKELSNTKKRAKSDAYPSGPTLWYGEQNTENIVLVGNETKADYIYQFSDLPFIKSLPLLVLPLPSFKDAACRAFEVDGDRMKSALLDQDIIIGKFIYDFSEIVVSCIYAIVTEKEVLVRRIVNYQPQDGLITYTADSEPFKTYTVHVSEILELWVAVGKFSTEICRASDDLGFHVSRFDNILHELKQTVEKLTGPAGKSGT